jgi:hypothetical protein
LRRKHQIDDLIGLEKQFPLFSNNNTE